MRGETEIDSMVQILTLKIIMDYNKKSHQCLTQNHEEVGFRE